MVSDGLACFLVSWKGGVDQRIVTDGVKASSKLPQFKAVNTVLSNLRLFRRLKGYGCIFSRFKKRDVMFLAF